MTTIIIASIVGVLIIAGLLFLHFSPQFGQKLTSDQQKEFAKLDNFKTGKFQNLHKSPMEINFWKALKEMTKKAPNRNPSQEIDVQTIDSATLAKNDTSTQVFWFGHSTFLIIMDGKKILIDPVFSTTPSPVSFLGPKRYAKNLPISMEELPFIDAVIISHDHYDHLDYATIKNIKHKAGQFFTPLGVKNHLVAWGVAADKVTALNWWDTVAFDHIQLVCTPARHFAGRGLLDRSTTLWSSWIIKGHKDNIFFSGDSGYDIHFKEIGDKYGPFDLSLMECGQYNEDWKYLHMMPEETAQAAADLNSKLTMPIHWGAFSLAYHDWTDPVERMKIKAHELNVSVATPQIGEPLLLGNHTYPTSNWWTEYVKDNNEHE